MSKRVESRKRQEARHWAERQYIRHRRHNLVYGKPGTHDFVIILDNLKPSFNIGKIFRSGDAFGAQGIHLLGTDYFEVKPAKGSFKWLPAVFHPTFHACYEQLAAEGYSFFILDPAAKLQLHQTTLPRKSAFIFGHEEHGISFMPSDYPEAMQSIAIQQYGRVDSLNVSVAASIVMYEYVRQHQSV